MKSPTPLCGNTAPCVRAARQQRAATSPHGGRCDFLVCVQMPQKVLIAQKCCLVAGKACASQYDRHGRTGESPGKCQRVMDGSTSPKGLQELGLLSLEGAQGCVTNAYKDLNGAKRTKSASFHWCLQTGQEARGTSCNTGGSL